MEGRDIDDVRAHLLGLVAVALDGEGGIVALLYGVGSHHKEIAGAIGSLDLVGRCETRMVRHRILIGDIRDEAVAKAGLAVVAHAVEHGVGEERRLCRLGGVGAQRVAVVVVCAPLAGLVYIDRSGVLLAIKLGGGVPIELQPSRRIGLLDTGKAHGTLATACLDGDIDPLIDIGDDNRTVLGGQLNPSAVVGIGVLVVITDIGQDLDLRFVAELSIHIGAGRGPVVVGAATGKDKHLEVHLATAHGVGLEVVGFFEPCVVRPKASYTQGQHHRDDCPNSFSIHIVC